MEGGPSSEVQINRTETQSRPKTFEEKVKALIEPADERTPALVTNQELVDIAEKSIMPHNQTLEDVLAFKKEVNEAYSRIKKQKPPEEEFQKFYQELMLLGKEMADRIQELSPTPAPAPARETPVAAALATATERSENYLRQMSENLKVSGYDGLVSAEFAQARIDVKNLDTHPQLWYSSLAERQKRIIRMRQGILSGVSEKRVEGSTNLDAIFDCKDVRINTDSLAAMWEGDVPGFRIALATMIQELFTYEEDAADTLLRGDKYKFLTISKSKIVVPEKKDNETPEQTQFRKQKEKERDTENEKLGAARIARLSKYKDDLIERLKGYFERNPNLISAQATHNGPSLNPELAARAAFSTAWNFLFLGNAVESGDVGRNVKQSEAWAEQLRAMIRPLDKGKSKWGVGKKQEEDKVATDESWGGPLGDWMAERCRHNPEFNLDVKEGRRRYFPTRMAASFFDLTTFGDAKKDCPDPKVAPIWGKTLSEIFTETCKPVAVPDNPNLFDFNQPDTVDFNLLEASGTSELWGGYMDTMDSARVVYRFINGTFKKEVGVPQLSTALKKLRAESLLEPIYSDPQLIAACIAMINNGPVRGSNELILKIEEETYDAIVTTQLSEDRLFAGMKEEDAIRAKTEIFRILHAKNYATTRGELISFLGGMIPLASERVRLRRTARENLARVTAQSLR